MLLMVLNWPRMLMKSWLIPALFMDELWVVSILDATASMGCNALSIVKLSLLMYHLLMHANPKLKIIIQDNDWFHQVRLLTNHILYCTGNSSLCCQILRQYLVSMFLYHEHSFLILSCSSMRYVKPCESAHHGLSPDAP